MSGMTRKDYTLLADSLKAARFYSDRAPYPSSFLHGCDASSVEIANTLQADNGRFERARFLLAAGVDTEPTPGDGAPLSMVQHNRLACLLGEVGYRKMLLGLADQARSRAVTLRTVVADSEATADQWSQFAAMLERCALAGQHADALR